MTINQQQDATTELEDKIITDEEGEAAIAALKKDMPSEAQTRYNQRDIKKRRGNKKYGIQNTRR